MKGYEVAYMTAAQVAECVVNTDTKGTGWYWRSPELDFEPIGPFKSAAAAIHDAEIALNPGSTDVFVEGE